MEQFRQLGEVLGSLQSLMVFQDDIRINHQQCLLLFNVLRLAFESISTEITQSLKFEEKQARWKVLDHPLRELVGIFRGAEQYIRHCLDSSKDWWAKAVSLNYNNDAVKEHVYKLLWCVPVVFEAVEAAVEIHGCESEETQRKKIVISKKYERDWLDPKLFEIRFGKQYLISFGIVNRLEMVNKEDRWALMDTISGKRYPGASPTPTRHEVRMADIITSPRGMLLPTSILVGAKDYQVKRRLGNSSHFKEIQWMGGNFAVLHFFGNVEPLVPEMKLLSSLSHPNILPFLGSFSDEDRKECFLLMEMMGRDLCNYIKEISSPRRKHPFSLPVAVDIMLQVARGMEYLCSHKIPHGNLHPSTILLKSDSNNHLHVKITGFGLSSLKSYKNNDTTNQCIWSAPEVLQALELRPGSGADQSKSTEKADVYSFGMLCFQLLTGKVPFEDSHLQGDKISRNIRAGERPLFPSPPPKYLTTLTKKCWQTDPSSRPNFSTICRILRYIKRLLLLNPDQHCRPDTPAPAVDYFDIDSSLCRRIPTWASTESTVTAVSQIPFQMFAYRLVEREKSSLNYKDRSSDSGSDGASVCGDDNGYNSNNISPDETTQIRSPSRSPPRPSSESSKKPTACKKVVASNGKKSYNKQAVHHHQVGQQKKGKRPSQLSPWMYSSRTHSDGHIPPLAIISPRDRRAMSGHTSDSELA